MLAGCYWVEQHLNRTARCLGRIRQRVIFEDKMYACTLGESVPPLYGESTDGYLQDAWVLA